MIQSGLYRHFKGGFYRVISVAKHSETQEPMVVYQALYGEKGQWVRPLSMFDELIERNGKSQRRFSYSENQTQGMQQFTLRVKAGHSHLFEAAFQNIAELLVLQRGYMDHKLRRNIEKGGQYQLQLTWQDLENDPKRFETLDDYDQWQAMLDEFCEKSVECEFFGLNVAC